MDGLTPLEARFIIDRLGGPGEPPEWGTQYFTSGLEPYLDVIRDEYLRSYLPQGGSTFKLVVGTYGGGKTHFLYCLRDLAWQDNFVVAYVSLSHNESPFYDLERVYAAVARQLLRPLGKEELLQGFERGFPTLLRTWFLRAEEQARSGGLGGDGLRQALLEQAESLAGIDYVTFLNAVQSAFKALLDHREGDFNAICQWLQGEGFDRSVHGKFGIYQKIDRTNAFTMLKALVQWVRQIGYAGLIMLFDEGERDTSFTGKQKDRMLTNLRELIDECGQTSFQSALVVYAVPDDNFLQGNARTYEALRQRLESVFELFNPSGVRLDLEKLVPDAVPFLTEVGEKLAGVYAAAYQYTFPDGLLPSVISLVIERVTKQTFQDISYKRRFVRTLIRAFNQVRATGALPDPEEIGV